MVNRGGSDRRYFCGTLTAPDQVNVDPASYSTHKTDLAIGRLSYDFGPVTLRYTGSWAKYQAFALQDQHLNTFGRSEEHTSELQSLMRNSYAVFCLKKKKYTLTQILTRIQHRTKYAADLTDTTISHNITY